jgi:hypothetical protein
MRARRPAGELLYTSTMIHRWYIADSVNLCFPCTDCSTGHNDETWSVDCRGDITALCIPLKKKQSFPDVNAPMRSFGCET